MTESVPEPERKNCPNCGELINAGAILCRFCDSGISPAHFRGCPFCAEMVRNEATFCRVCRSDFSYSSQKPIAQEEYGTGATRKQVFEVLVRQALAGTHWREVSARLMQINNIDPKDIEDAVSRRRVRQQLVRERGDRIIDWLRGEVDTRGRKIFEGTEEELRARINEIISLDKTPLTMMEKEVLMQNVLAEILIKSSECDTKSDTEKRKIPELEERMTQLQQPNPSHINIPLLRERQAAIIDQVCREFGISNPGKVGGDIESDVRDRIKELVQAGDLGNVPVMKKRVLLQNILDELFGRGTPDS